MNLMGREAELVERARKMRERAYAPYSTFQVGAALLGRSGKIYEGCNVENSAYPSGLCAEHAAVAVAVAAGEREFLAIAVACPEDKVIAPCGKCRQVLAEFSPDMVVLLAAPGGFRQHLLSDLLPERFDETVLLEQLKKNRKEP